MRAPFLCADNSIDIHKSYKKLSIIPLLMNIPQLFDSHSSQTQEVRYSPDQTGHYHVRGL
jgi:hypothetical protein